MFGFVDKYIEKRLKKRLHKKRIVMIEKTLERFLELHPDADTARLRQDLEHEANRIYAVVDHSILTAGLRRARFSFWVMLISTILIISIVSYLTAGSALVFLAPPVSALLNWVIAIGVIPVSYNERIKGSMDSILKIHELDWMAKNTSPHTSFKVQQVLQNQLSMLKEEVDLLPVTLPGLSESSPTPRLDLKSVPSPLSLSIDEADSRDSSVVRWHY